MEHNVLHNVLPNMIGHLIYFFNHLFIKYVNELWDEAGTNLSKKPLVEFDSFTDFEFMNHDSAAAKTKAFKTMSLKHDPFAISTITRLIRID